MRGIRDYLMLFFKGLGMGSADVVPGVSGGTIAFITGIYEELLGAIRSVDGTFLRLLLRFKVGEAWKHVNGNFLLAVGAGIAVSVLSLAKVISHLLEDYPIQVWSFFFGLVVISAILVAREVKQWNMGAVIALVVGAAAAFAITSFSPAQTPENPLFVFFTGAVAICAMILPGISGSFILLIMGKYQYIFDAINNRDFVVLGIFAAGCLTGLLSFARLLSWLLTKYHNLTVALLAGFMVGSLNKIWPWKEVLETMLDRHGELRPLVERNVLPNAYTGEPYVLQAVGFFFLGILLVFSIDRLARAMQDSKAA